MEILIFLVIWAAFGVGGAMIMSGKGRSGCGGFAIGVLLGPIGLVMALLMRPSEENEAERQLRIDQMKGGMTAQAAGTHGPVEEPRIGVNIEWAIFPTKGSRYRWECRLCRQSGQWVAPREEAVRQSRLHQCSSRATTPSPAPVNPPPAVTTEPNVFVRELEQIDATMRYRWECDSCGKAGEWTEDEVGAESQAEEHTCARRIPRRR